VTTNTLDNAIAAPASIELSRAAAAAGSAATALAYAQNRLALIVRRIRRGQLDGISRGPQIAAHRVRSLASIATSVPVPMARPRSAWARGKRRSRADRTPYGRGRTRR
jgi:hypothetical protein